MRGWHSLSGHNSYLMWKTGLEQGQKYMTLHRTTKMSAAEELIKPASKKMMANQCNSCLTSDNYPHFR